MEVDARHDGDLIIREDQTLKGRVDGSVRVVGGHLTLAESARVTRNLVVERGTAIVLGQVDGDVVNIDGTVSVHGRVRGSVRGPDQATSVARDALIGPQSGDERHQDKKTTAPEIQFVPTSVDAVVPRLSRPSDRLRTIRRWWSWHTSQQRLAWQIGGVVALVVGIVIAGIAGAALLGDADTQSGVPSTTVAPTPNTTASDAAVPDNSGPAAPPTTVGGDGIEVISRQRLETLDVVAVLEPETAYDPVDYPDIAVIGGCRRSSDAALSRLSTVDVVESLDQCFVIEGAWTDVWTGEAISDRALVEVDIGVPMANAHASGAWAWDIDERIRLANDVRRAFAIGTTTAADRGDAAPQDWKPPLEAQHCLYAAVWIDVKSRWGLVITDEEADGLSTMLDGCDPSETVPDWLLG